MKRFFVLVLAYVCVLVSSRAAEASDMINIGVLTELSGSEAANGKACKLGYDAAERMFLTRGSLRDRVRIIYGDHRADPMTALSEFKRLSEIENISGIVANRGPVGMALDPVTRDAGVPFLGISGHVGFIQNNPYGIRVWLPLGQDGILLAEEVYRQGFRRVSIVALMDDYILAMAEAFRRRFEELGGVVSYSDQIDKSLNDFRSIVSAIQQSRPDVIFANGSVAQLGLLIRKIREQQLNQQIISNFWVSYADVVQGAGRANIEGTLFVGHDLNRPKFREQVISIDPSAQITGLTYACYSALALVLATIDSHPEVRDRTSLHHALMATSELKLPDEVVPIRNREMMFSFVPYRILNGLAVADRQ